jgi:hypothetical protein
MANRPRRFLLYSLAAVVPAIGLLAGTAAAASARTVTVHTATRSAAAQARALAVAEVRKLTVGYRPADHQVGIKSPGMQGLSDVESTNWSGYADTGSSFSQVSASWTEPSATCSSRQEQLAAFWVGIDGYSSDSVEQDGTLIECYDRTAYQYTWWEMYPGNAMQVVGETVHSGDSIYVAVTRSGVHYTLTATDYTHPANSFTTTQTCSDCANSSAEWIAEAPSGSSGIYPLADFGKWTLTSSSVANHITGVISSFPCTEITMTNSSGKVKAQTSALNSSGSGFSVTWKSST